MDRKILTAPFPPEIVRTRPGKKGQQLRYIQTWAVIERLNAGCDSWEYHIDEYKLLKTEVVVLIRLVADGTTKSAFGSASVTVDKQGEVVSVGDDLKAAASDALKKAASLLGVGLELYGGSSQQLPPATAAPQARQAPHPGAQQNDDRCSEGATVRQLTAIHAASRRRGFDKRQLSEFVSSESGKRDISHLSKAEASQLIDSLNASSNGVSH